MAETGHAKNVANFETLIIICTAYGTQYNPTKASLSLIALTKKQKAGADSLTQINTMLPPWQNDIGAREIIFAPLSKLITRVSNAVAASDVTPQFIKEVKTITRKLQGKRATPKVPISPTPPATDLLDTTLKSISASQMSFDNRTANMEKLNLLLASNPNYIPNETDLTVAVLTTLQTNMATSNTAVKTDYTPLSNSRIDRNKILYDTTTGLVELAGEVKKYIKSVFGGTSAQYKQVSGLEFRYIPG